MQGSPQARQQLPLPVAPVLVPVEPEPMVLEPDEPRPELAPELVEP
jgi:hypothetical protein